MDFLVNFYIYGEGYSVFLAITPIFPCLANSFMNICESYPARLWKQQEYRMVSYTAGCIGSALLLESSIYHTVTSMTLSLLIIKGLRSSFPIFTPKNSQFLKPQNLLQLLLISICFSSEIIGTI